MIVLLCRGDRGKVMKNCYVEVLMTQGGEPVSGIPELDTKLVREDERVTLLGFSSDQVHQNSPRSHP